jgi:hypothetical protein
MNNRAGASPILMLDYLKPESWAVRQVGGGTSDPYKPGPYDFHYGGKNYKPDTVRDRHLPDLGRVRLEVIPKQPAKKDFFPVVIFPTTQEEGVPYYDWSETPEWFALHFDKVTYRLHKDIAHYQILPHVGSATTTTKTIPVTTRTTTKTIPPTILTTTTVTVPPTTKTTTVTVPPTTKTTTKTVPATTVTHTQPPSQIQPPDNVSAKISPETGEVTIDWTEAPNAVNYKVITSHELYLEVSVVSIDSNGNESVPSQKVRVQTA